MTKQRKAAGYSPKNTEEITAISKLTYLLNLTQVKPDIKEHDKFPNIDGYLELTTPTQDVIGKLEVQIKKLPKANSQKVKFQTDMSFITYCKDIALLPVVFIVVDIDSEIAYWEYFSKRKSTDLSNGSDKNSIVVHFNMDNRISREDFRYFDQWVEIINQHQTKLIGYDQLHESHGRTKAMLDELSKLSNISIGSSNETNMYIHKFLDMYNNFLDNEFTAVKRIFYPNVWKIGLAYMKFNDNEVEYFLYQVDFRFNDTLIKKLDWNEARGLTERYGFTMSMYNHIINEPEKVVKKLLEDHVVSIFKNRNLLMINEFLAHEYVSNFIRFFGRLIEKYTSDPAKLTITDLSSLILGQWCAMGFEYKYKDIEGNILDTMYRLDINLDDVRNSINTGFRYGSEFQKSAKFNKYRSRMRIISNDFDMIYLENCIDFLTSNGVIYAVNPFLPTDTIRQNNRIWSGYSKERMLNNIETMVLNLIDSYDSYLGLYFPKLFNELKFIGKYDLVIVTTNDPEEYSVKGPQIRVIMYYAKENSNMKPSIHFFEPNKSPVSFNNYHQDIVFNGSEYEFRASHGINRLMLFGKTPMLDTLYDYLQTRFDSYFKSML